MKAIFAAAALIAQPALAADLSCHPSGVQVSCDKGKCLAEPDGETTPMVFDRTGNRLSICAGESCWEGPLLMRRSRDGFDFLYGKVKLTQRKDADPEPLAVLYDAGDKTALIRWGGYATPMDCGAQ